MRKKWTLQERNLAITKWADVNNVFLLPETAEFKDNKSPIYYKWLDGEFKDLIGKTKFDSIVTEIRPTVNGLTDESKQIRAKKRFLEYGLDLLEDYKGFSVPHSVKILSGKYAGYYGKIALATVNQKQRRGKTSQLNITTLTDNEKKRYFNTYASSRGYTILDYPKGLAVRGACRLLSPQGNIWETTWYFFAYNEGNNCPKDIKVSINERRIRALLDANEIPYETEKSIRIGDRSLRLDFYLPTYNSAIEFNGKQHYKEGSGYFEGALPTIQERDELKVQWCKDNDVTLYVIPYTENTTEKVATALAKFLPINNTNVNIAYN